MPRTKKKPVVVLTYGTYDLLTAGHVEHFRDAKAMGDYLIVGVSTDEFNAIKHKSSYLNYEERKFVVESIRATLSHKDYNWYGVDFETALPSLISQLSGN